MSEPDPSSPGQSGPDPASGLRDAVTAAARNFSGDQSLRPSLESSPRPEMGDYSSNAAMVMSKSLGRPPREVAAELSALIEADLGDLLDRTEIAGPGFINLFLADEWYRRAITSLADGGWKVPPVERPERILVESVSANPTGPLTAASGRHAAHGDAITRLLRATGHEVSTEYYVNDGGTQIENFAASIAARMTGAEPPEDGYRGEYVSGLADRAGAEGIGPDELELLARAGVGWMVESIRASLIRFGVEMDGFFSERSLYEEGLVERGIERLREAGHTFEQDGALWLRTSEFGDDKDRVLVRSGGEPTYFGADVAYHADKVERGFTRLIDVLGADHHGYIARMAAAIQSMERPGISFEVQILQMIHLIEGGRRTKMSKRAGDIVTLDELLDDIGSDAARFFLLQRSSDRTMDLDLDLARSQSSENPVYYVQYAHARIQSILRKAAGSGRECGSDGPTRVAVDPSEKALIERLLDYPAEVHEAASRLAPHRICAYATEVAAAYHAFYRDCQVIGAEGEGLEASRLNLCRVTGETIKRSLALLGISAPDRM
ncbi:MAG: arginine--tRNA ligase [Thermoleophilia bacterium]|nr:arginine--tRNA ligase [Thermoleophilia bacterium]